MLKRVGIWICNELNHSNAENCIIRYLENAQKYAKEKGWETAEVYIHNEDVDIPVTEHDSYKKMLEDIKLKKINALICTKLDCLCCKTKELFETFNYFKRHNIDFVSLSDKIDTSTALGKQFYSNVNALCECENNVNTRKTCISLPKRAKSGKSLGGAAPYGYQWVNSKLEINANEAPVRKLIFEYFTKLKQKNAVAKKLNEQGHRTRRGNKFTDTTVDRLLKDTIVIGERIVNYTQSTGHNKHWKVKPKSEWVVVTTPKIISKELFYEVQSILNAKKTTSKAL